MRWKDGAVIWAVCFLGIFFASSAAGQGNELQRRIVVFEEWFVNPAAQEALIEVFGGQSVLPLPIVNGVAVYLPPPAIEALGRRAEIRRVEIDAVVYASAKPPWAGNDKGQEPTLPPQQLPWGIDRIDADLAWNTTRGTGIDVAVLDTGIDLDHPDLAANIAGGVNFISSPPWKPPKSNQYDDDNGHGTHVAGIIAAVDDEFGTVGVAPEASLYAVKVLDRNGSGYVSQVIAGIEWAVSRGTIRLINMSLSSNSHVQSLKDACDAAAAEGLLLVAAAGNDGGAVDYPAAYPSVVAVAATDSGDYRAAFSSYGQEVDLAAPGVSVFSSYLNGGYATLSGTSMAAPHVTGTLALALAADPMTPAADVLARMLATTIDLSPTGWDVYTGSGLVDALATAVGDGL